MATSLVEEPDFVGLGPSLAPEGTRSQVQDALARACWTVIAEPGDRVAGALVAHLGAASALRALGGGDPAQDLLKLLRGHPGEEPAPVEAIEAPNREEIVQGCERWQPRLDQRTLLRTLEAAATAGHRLLTPEHPHWPRPIRDLGAHAPLALWALGTKRIWPDPTVAIVGARAVSRYGASVTADLSAGVADRAFAIVSGGALGVDGIAHRTALASGVCTVAFLAGGLDKPYPAAHGLLFERIVDGGVLVSEQPIGASPTRWRFLQRNRLIAAAATATVVVEAGLRSGSLNTAAHAATLGRPVGAVPGPVSSVMSAGCHRLIRDQNAVLVRDAADVAELALPGETQADAEPFIGSRVLVQDRVPRGEGTRTWDALSPRTSRSVDQLAQATGISPRDTLRVLGKLELLGLVEHRLDGWRRLPLRAG